MDEQYRQLAEKFKALGDPTRLRIVQILARQGETCVCEIVPQLGIPQSTVSHHLATLRHAGLIRQRRDSQMIFYSLTDGRDINDLLEFIQEAVSVTKDRVGAA